MSFSPLAVTAREAPRAGTTQTRPDFWTSAEAGSRSGEHTPSHDRRWAGFHPGDGTSTGPFEAPDTRSKIEERPGRAGRFRARGAWGAPRDTLLPLIIP